jgi:subtilisin family serine protease
VTSFALLAGQYLAASNDSAIGAERSGVLLGAPTAPSKLRDNDGRWLIVAGIPVQHGIPHDDAVIIAIIDSGVLANHPQIAGLISDTADFTGEGIEDRIGHGTVVAILAGRGVELDKPANQPATPLPRLIIAKVAQADGTIDKDAVIQAIGWSIQRGARVVNLSLGFPSSSGDYSDLCLLIAQKSKALFVAAAGNSGPSVRMYPASCESQNVLSVGTPDEWSGNGAIRVPGTIGLIPQP